MYEISNFFLFFFSLVGPKALAQCENGLDHPRVSSCDDVNKGKGDQTNHRLPSMTLLSSLSKQVTCRVENKNKQNPYFDFLFLI